MLQSELTALRKKRYLDAYVMREYDKLTFREIGSVLNVSIERARQICANGKKHNDFLWRKFYMLKHKV